MILRPLTEDEVAETVRSAEGPLEIRGGGTRPLGNPVQAAATLDLSGLAGITLYEPGALTLIARAGTPLAGIERALAAEGQMLAFEPPDWRDLLGTSGTPTIGGAVATNASGPRRVTAGACRDSLIGLRFVDGTGRVVKNGGRVMKNVTGLDLVRLLAGSHGTLGVMTEVAFRVVPRPETSETLVFRGLGDGVAAAAMTAALGSPFGVSGAAHLPDGTLDRPGTPATLLRVEGRSGLLSARAARLAALLALHGRAEPMGAAGAAEWPRIGGVRPFAARDGAVWRLSLRPTGAPAVLSRLRAALPDLGHFLDRGGGLLWLLVPEAGDCGAGAIRRAVAEAGGHATLVRAAPATRLSLGAFPPEAPAVAALSAGLRARFDPKGILNPGRMG